MSTRTTLRPNPVATAADMSGNITSAVTILQSITFANYAVSWTGAAPVGTLSVQASDDYQANGSTVINAGTWNSLPLELAGSGIVTAIPLSGNTGNGMIDIPNLGAYAIRLVYTRTSGTGSLTAIITGKVA